MFRAFAIAFAAILAIVALGEAHAAITVPPAEVCDRVPGWHVLETWRSGTRTGQTIEFVLSCIIGPDGHIELVGG